MIKSFRVAMDNLEKVQKAANRIEKKANKYGKLFSISYGEPYSFKREILELDEHGNTHKVDDELVDVLDVTIESESICLDGYTVLARIEHCEGGNIVNTFANDYSPEWANIPAKCDHCGGNHGQKVTFIVSNGETTKQVGRTCLKDYCGIDPQMIGYLNELQDLILDEEIDNARDVSERSYAPVFDTIEVLATAVAVVRKQGYVRSGDCSSNKEAVAYDFSHHKTPTDDDYAKAKLIADCVSSMDANTAFMNMLDNVRTFVNCGYCKESHFGYLAYAPVAYDRYMEKVKKEQERLAAKSMEKGSEYVGSVGDKVELHLDSAMLVTSWETQFGYTHLYKFVSNGNVFIWFASRGIDCENAKVLKGTIKDHTERDGVKQTVLTRCKVA